MLLKANLKLDELDVYELIHAVECQFNISLPDSIAKDYAKGLDCTVAELIQKIENVANKKLAKADATAASLKEKTDALAEKAMKLGEAVYKASQAEQASEEQKKNDDGTVDADFSEKK